MDSTVYNIRYRNMFLSSIIFCLLHMHAQQQLSSYTYSMLLVCVIYSNLCFFISIFSFSLLRFRCSDAMEPQVELSPEGAGAMSADADADAGLAAQDAAAVDTRSAAETSAKCCSVRGEALWNMAMWATYFNLFCCLPRLIILPGMFINIVRGPLYGFFVHPLWALVYCSCTLVLVMCKDDPQADALIDPFQFVAWLTNRVGGSTALHRVRDCVSVGRRRAAVLNMVWILLDWVLTALTFGISLGFLLLVFTEWDGEVTSGFNAEYAVIVVGIVFCGMSLLSEIVIFASLGLFVCSTCCQPTSPTDSNPDSAEAGRPEAGEAAVEKSHGLDQAPDAIKAMNGLSVYFICAVSIASCVLLSFCIHDSLRGQYYHHDTDADYGTCDGLVPIRCALPFPSSFWLEAGHSTGTGYKVTRAAVLQQTVLTAHFV